MDRLILSDKKECIYSSGNLRVKSMDNKNTLTFTEDDIEKMQNFLKEQYELKSWCTCKFETNNGIRVGKIQNYGFELKDNCEVLNQGLTIDEAEWHCYKSAKELNLKVFNSKRDVVIG